MLRVIVSIGRCLLLWAAVGAGACVSHSKGASEDAGREVSQGDAGSAACGGRGQALDGLAVEGSAGLELDIVAFEPSPPVVGDNSWLVRLTQDGEPVTGVAPDIAVSPHMPDHNHGSPVSVGVEETEPGLYRFEPVNTFMPGYWQIDVEVASAELEGSVQFGVCVE